MLVLSACNVLAEPAPPATEAPAPAPGATFGGVAWLRPGSPPLGLISFQETGLRPGMGVTLVATADALASYDCLGRDGRLARTSIPITAQVSDLKQLIAGADGSLRGAFSLSPPPSASGCPPGSTPYALTSLYTDGQVSDVTDRVGVPVPGSFGRAPGVQDR